MTSNNTSATPLSPVLSKLEPIGLFYGTRSHPPSTKPSYNSMQTLQPDEYMLPADREIVPIPESTQLSPPPPKPVAKYVHPQIDQRTPEFVVGRYRFPAPVRRLLPSLYAQPQHTPQHPGTFPSPQFEDEIWSSSPFHINDSHITSLSPEHNYFGIDYFVDIHELIWAKQPVSRGTTIIFRGYDVRLVFCLE